ncbi:TonB family protein [Sulfurimonas aquatica]|uniref:TonB family protein n=1 Tax=Sulfurimonas aquatica TaxID=2672570 RepID=A0A975AZ47_9BACT|nr:energy transducer TonB [Sulfurimonas aquatica]QSZ41266.1 TonB family protein [Sulfurimonas aquatica]
MIRHSSSFFLSVVIHLAFGATALLIYMSLPSKDITPKEELICMSLSCFSEQKKVSELKKITKEKVIKKVQKHPEPNIVKQKVIKHEVVKTKTPKKEEIKKVKKVLIKKTKELQVPKIEKPQEKKIEKEIPKEEPIIERVAEAQAQAVKIDTNNTIEPPKKIVIKEDPDKVYVENHIDEIVSLLKENLYYPRSARKRGVEGSVVVRFTILKDAKVEDIKVLSSDKEILSRAAIKTIEDLSYMFPKPQERLTISLPINYKLR